MPCIVISAMLRRILALLKFGIFMDPCTGERGAVGCHAWRAEYGDAVSGFLRN